MAELRCGRSLTIPNFYDMGRRGVEKGAMGLGRENLPVPRRAVTVDS